MNNRNIQKNNKQKAPKSFFRQFVLSVLILIIFASAYGLFKSEAVEIKEIGISNLVVAIEAGEINSIVVKGETVEVVYSNGDKGSLKKESGAPITQTLTNYGLSSEAIRSVAIEVENERGFAYWLTVIIPFLLPLLIFIVLLWILLGQFKNTGSQAFNFGKSRARVLSPDDPSRRITFKDVAGVEEAKEELGEFVDFLKNPRKYKKMGAKVPKGLLLTGSPGTGKTLLAKAVAGEAKVSFFTISGSEFVEMFVGVGASRVRDLFRNAKKHSPSVIFIDEIDAVGRTRGTGVGGGNDEREQTLNQILVEMDGFESRDNVIVIAATNRPDVLDHALLRPGRFDRRLVIDVPDKLERMAILKIHARGKPMDKNVNFDSIAAKTPGFSGADLYSVVNEAAILAARKGNKALSQKDFADSVEKVALGPEKKTRILTDHEKRRIAFHEGGHALLASVLPYADPVQKISIISRGHALGYVLSTPDKDYRLRTKQKFLDDMVMAMGGYAAEQIVFGDVSTGPSSDLEKVTQIARNMVTNWGMSEKIGPTIVSNSKYNTQRGGNSNETQKMIDREVQAIVKNTLKKATMYLKKYRKALNALAEKLLQVETMERNEFEKLITSQGVKIQNALGR
ncbi:MAG: ATP-dependent zinc metalloprotease FtsH [Candidatus Campbellbacteria bacterium]|nr:ATP-dependent zinc metalloprotease FtsH [Candidatus Campbellbacteria bacterium]